MNSHILWTTDDMSQLHKYIMQNKFTHMSFDLETNGVEEITAKVFGIGVAFDDEDGFYIPIRNKDGTDYWPDNMLPIHYVNSLLSTCKLIGHNIIYDSLVWWHNYAHDLTPNITDDTILLKHLIDEEQPFGLKEVAVKYLGPWADKAQQAMIENIKANGGHATKNNMEMWKCDTDVLGEYCCWDVLLTFKLFNLFKPMLEQQGLLELYETEVMPLYREVTIPMKRMGIHIDIKHFEKLKHDIVDDIEALEHELLSEHISAHTWQFEKELLNAKAPIKKTGSFPRHLAKVLEETLPTSLSKKELEKHSELRTVQWILGTGPELNAGHLSMAQLSMFFEKYPDQNYVFNLRSRDHMKYLFFEVLQETPLSTTDKGSPQIDDDFLESIKDKYAWVPLLQDLNKLEKLKGTYIEGILDRQIDGKIYTSMLQFGTTSGRYASRSPNLQNLPRPKEEDSGLSERVLKYTNAIRAGFISSSGRKLVDADYSALEPRCFATASGDENLQAIFHSGEDMYSAIAKRVFKLEGVSTFKKDPNFLGKLFPEKRQIIKALALAVTYGAEAFRIADLLGVSKDEAQILIDDYLAAYPGLKNYIATCHYEANTNGYVRTMFGRIRHLPEAQSIFKSYGSQIIDSRWAKKHGVSDIRRVYKNKLNNSTNVKIQGLAAHIINRAMININREFKSAGIDGWVTLSIHDQVVCSVAEAQAEQAQTIVKNCMENVIKLSVPLIAEPKIAMNLRDSH